MEKEKNPWKELARKAVHAKRREATRARELDDVVRELHGKLGTAVEERDALENRAAEIIEQRDMLVDQVKAWCDRYIKGSVSAMEALPSITALVGGDSYGDVSVLERRRAAEQMTVLRLMAQATDRLSQIEILMHNEGIPNVIDQVHQVREAVEQRNASEEDKHRLWELFQKLLPRLGADDELQQIFAREDRAGLEDYLESADV